MPHQLIPVSCLGLFPGYSLHQLKFKSFDISKFNLFMQLLSKYHGLISTEVLYYMKQNFTQ